MEKLTSDLYDFTQVYDPKSGTKTTLHHTEYGTKLVFHTVDPLISPERIWQHMHTMTDSQCHQWLDEPRAEEEKKAAKEEAKKQRAILQAAAQQEREDKMKKKEENRRQQREALQRKQEAQSN